jgi:hypothetical protein
MTENSQFENFLGLLVFRESDQEKGKRDVGRLLGCLQK